ncbi:tRNA 2-thiouridine(34) synthase MnmA [Candidatus Falkowbacteria bacterium]|nr:tRNA 2-thiouridine(34) synthase MnmA [Candidatus Falkowbacteria bacterium]
MKQNQDKKIIVGMSGGVDSSVSLALLKEQGWVPIGVSLKYSVWHDKENILRENICCSAESFRLAKEVCRRLDVPHRVIDASGEFQRTVIDYFIKELKRGKTPNPCIICNRYLKFKKLFEVARKERINYVATGHYARIKVYPERSRGSKYELVESRDKQKDQTYSLCLLPQKWLKHIVFPLADYKKEEILELAKKRGFDFYLKRKESQDFCFVANKCLNCFLEKEIGRKAGLIRDTNGNVLGQHSGLHFYTIGQRKGLYLPNGPYFVVGKNIRNNALVVSKKEKDLCSRGAVLSPYNLVSDRMLGVSMSSSPQTRGGSRRGVEKNFIEVMAKVRYSASPARAILRPLSGNKIELIFKKPQKAITPGQFAVFYRGNVCLGGGRILKNIL